MKGRKGGNKREGETMKSKKKETTTGKEKTAEEH